MSCKAATLPLSTYTGTVFDNSLGFITIVDRWEGGFLAHIAWLMCAPSLQQVIKQRLLIQQQVGQAGEQKTHSTTADLIQKRCSLITKPE